MSKTRKIILISAMAILFIVVHVSTCFFVGDMVADFAFNSKLKAVEQSVEDFVTNDYLEDTEQVFKEERDWYLNIKKEVMTINTHDNTKLNSIKIFNAFDTDKWVIIVHGYRGSSSQMSNYAKHYYENGYNVLLPDLRAHGLSGGDFITFGWKDRLDLLLWIDEIIKMDSSAQIVLHGLSMGASTVMMTTGEHLPLNVKVAVSDCGYSSVYDEFCYLATDYLKIQTWPIINSVMFYGNNRLGFNLNEASATEQLKKSVTPTLFIHGEKDTFVPYFMLEKNYNSATNLIENETKQMLTVADAIHGMSAGVDEKLYWDTVWNFVGKFIIQ